MTTTNDYFKKVDLLPLRLIVVSLPLVFWSFIWYNWGGLSDFNQSLNEQKRRLTKRYISKIIGMNIGDSWQSLNYYLLLFRRTVFIMALLLPFIYTIVNFYPLFTHKLGKHKLVKKADASVCSAPCFRQINSKKLNDMGIVGAVDLDCDKTSGNCASNTIGTITLASNIISLCSFLLVLLIYRQIPSAWDERKALNHWVIISLLLGFIINIFKVIEGLHYITMWFTYPVSVLLSMNIASFVVVMTLISTQVLFEFF